MVAEGLSRMGGFYHLDTLNLCFQAAPTLEFHTQVERRIVDPLLEVTVIDNLPGDALRRAEKRPYLFGSQAGSDSL
jgi:hypothetical protein